jgi:hypothetical protein
MKPNIPPSIYNLSVFLFLALCACNSGKEEQKDISKKENKPLNIIYIMADDHAYQAVSAYG